MREADEFFSGKRVWSEIKDQIISGYMKPYLAMVNTMRRPILLIDGFAGPGIYGDGSEGSPLHMCAAAERYARGNYAALFVNRSAKYHTTLSKVLLERGYTTAVPIHGRAEELLTRLPNALTNQTVLIYLDPFGLNGYDFSHLEPFLDRDHAASTEIIVNVHMPIIHRLAARNTIRMSQSPDRRVRAYHTRLTRTLGGDYWKEVMWDESLTPSERDWSLIEKYASRLRLRLPYVGFCPVREAETSRIKYFVVFASRHRNAMLLMNDIMAAAYYGHIHKQATTGSLWEGTPWAMTQQIRIGGVSAEDLDRIILDTVRLHSGESREDIWLHIVQAHFMRFTSSEYTEAVKRLLAFGKLQCPPDPRTKRINKDCPLYLR